MKTTGSIFEMPFRTDWRRYLRYSLAMLLVAMTAACAGFLGCSEQLAPAGEAEPPAAGESDPLVDNHDSGFDCEESPYNGLTTATAERLAALMRGTDESLALAAAWMRVLNDHREAQDADAVLQSQMHWMVGFIEGRLKTQPPEWWAKSLTSAVSNLESGQITFTLEGARWFDLSPTGFVVPLGGLVHEGADGVFLTLGGDTVRLPSEAIRRRDEYKRCRLSVCVSDEGCYLALYPPAPESYKLLRVDPDTADVLWSATVCCTDRNTLGTSGLRHHRVTVTQQDDRIFVYGIGSGTTAYVEVFRAEDGHKLCRFCTGIPNLPGVSE